jgi:hypothetical protein
MLRFVVDQPSRSGLSRREWLRIGGLGSLGWAAGLASPANPAWAKPGGKQAAGFGRARSVILIYASGGQSQLETWDPKPDAPAEVRGEFQAIPTAVPGTLLGEHMPRLAKIADKYTILRTLSHDDLDHGTASYLTFTGRFHRLKSANPPPAPTDMPTFGAVLKRVRSTDRFVYDAVHLNGPALVPTIEAPGQFAGILGHEYEPLVLGDVSSGNIAIPSLDPLPQLPPVRLHARQSLQSALDTYRRELEADPLTRMDTVYRQAFDLLDSPHCRTAFDLNAEPQALRDRYGRNRPGQACLLARRLVEAGVPLVTVMWSHSNRGQDKAPDDTEAYGWDTHNDIFEALKVHLLPKFDQGFSALLEDLDARGLLDQTLVVCVGEFGRAPLVALEPKFAGSTPGRKHWASVYSGVFAGAGVIRGGVVGASDRLAASPVTERFGPWDVAATIFSALGIDPSTHYRDPLDRPFAISEGRPITGLYG